MNFNQLSKLLKSTHDKLYRDAVRAVNTNLTLRNWLFGFYIVEFEQNGEDRAQYGKKLLLNLAAQLSLRGLTAPELSRCRQFYYTYPQILGLLTHEFGNSPISLKYSNVTFENIELSILGLPTQE